MKQQIIATGISGLVGSRLVELLGNKYDFINFSLDKGIDITKKELLDKKFIELPNIKIVLHLAAFTNVDAAFAQNEQKNSSCYQVNVIGTKNIAEHCAKTNKFLIHISTDFVFDGVNPPSGGYLETDTPKPLQGDWYGKTKYLAEQEIIQSGCRYAIARIAFPFKAKPAATTIEPVIKLDLVRSIMEKLKKKEPLNMFSDQIITPTFVDDIAKAIDKIITTQPKGIFHCIGSTSLSPYELAIKIATVFNLDPSLINKTNLTDYLKVNPTSRPRQVKSILSNQKIQQELGIKMSTIDEALREMKSQLTK
jgi:dTDP-4-dehydrorhamnose reductase